MPIVKLCYLRRKALPDGITVVENCNWPMIVFRSLSCTVCFSSDLSTWSDTSGACLGAGVPACWQQLIQFPKSDCGGRSLSFVRIYRNV